MAPLSQPQAENLFRADGVTALSLVGHQRENETPMTGRAWCDECGEEFLDALSDERTGKGAIVCLHCCAKGLLERYPDGIPVEELKRLYRAQPAQPKGKIYLKREQKCPQKRN